MNEAETRAEHIDPALKAAGWGVVDGSRVRREYPIAPGRIEGAGKRGKALTADYVLEYRNTKLAVIEAKAWDKPLTEGVGQAKDYAGKLAIRFTYSSNGQGIYAIDMHTGAEVEVAQFPGPEELWRRTFAKQNVWRDRFRNICTNSKRWPDCKIRQPDRPVAKRKHPGRYPRREPWKLCRGIRVSFFLCPVTARIRRGPRAGS